MKIDMAADIHYKSVTCLNLLLATYRMQFHKKGRSKKSRTLKSYFLMMLCR